MAKRNRFSRNEVLKDADNIEAFERMREGLRRATNARISSPPKYQLPPRVIAAVQEPTDSHEQPIVYDQEAGPSIEVTTVQDSDKKLTALEAAPVHVDTSQEPTFSVNDGSSDQRLRGQRTLTAKSLLDPITVNAQFDAIVDGFNLPPTTTPQRRPAAVDYNGRLIGLVTGEEKPTL